jgi:thiopurine S-methyltransferase
MTRHSFWQQRWKDKNIDFHQAKPNSLLVKCLPMLALKIDTGVFVPFCGASVDMVYLMQQGYHIIGSEISQLACEQFFEEQQLAYELIKIDGFTLYESEKIKIYCGDHYQLKPEWFSNVSAVYDRAAFVAVEPSQRAAYIEKLYQLVPNFKSLLIVQEYDESAKQGPPFSLNEQQVINYYQPLSIKKLAQTDHSPTTENLRGRGFVAALECCYLLE